MNDTKYAYAIGEPHSSPSLPDFASHGPLRHANIMFGHASPVAHLEWSNRTMGWRVGEGHTHAHKKRNVSCLLLFLMRKEGGYGWVALFYG